jgi:hypothetical protein
MQISTENESAIHHWRLSTLLENPKYASLDIPNFERNENFVMAAGLILGYAQSTTNKAVTVSVDARSIQGTPDDFDRLLFQTGQIADDPDDTGIAARNFSILTPKVLGLLGSSDVENSNPIDLAMSYAVRKRLPAVRFAQFSSIGVILVDDPLIIFLRESDEVLNSLEIIDYRYRVNLELQRMSSGEEESEDSRSVERFVTGILSNPTRYCFSCFSGAFGAQSVIGSVNLPQGVFDNTD